MIDFNVVMSLVWLAGVATSVTALVVADQRMERDPQSAFGPIARWFVATCGFAVFPVLGLVFGVILLYVSDREKGSQ
jgi:hypothetical protein